MKRVMAVLCAVFAALVVCGCAAAPSGQGSDSASSTAKATLKIGIDIYEPYTYYDDNGQLTGLDYELAVEACKRLGVTPEFVSISWEKKDELLASGAIDCVWSCYSMTGREDKYLWAGPYMNSYQAAVVRADSGITSLSQLAGRRVAVESTTKSEEAWVERAGEEVPAPSDVLTYTTMDETVSALQLGYVDATSGHVGPMTALVEDSDGTLELLPEGFYATQTGVAFDKELGDEAFVSRLDQTLKDMASDGTTARAMRRYGFDAETTMVGVNND